MIFDELTEVLDAVPHGAAMNMAIDEALLEAASAATLRIYRWASPAVSFGYFGKWADVARDCGEREAVRRWTGGGVVPHGADVTYSLIVPRGHPFLCQSPLESYRAIHDAVARVLGAASLADAAAPKISGACFENAARHDVLLDGRKVAGAAQRRTRFGLLHQGSIQPVDNVDRLAALLPGVFAEAVSRETLGAGVLAAAGEIAAAKYARESWLRRF